MVFVRVVCLLLVFQLAFSYGSRQCTGTDETCLMKYLKRVRTREDMDVRPAVNYTDTVLIRFGMALINIDRLTLIGNKQYKLTANVWLRHLWQDYRLSWNPEQFGGVDHIRIPIKYIWRPDLVLYNNLEMDQQVSAEALAVVSSDGTILWIPTAKITVPVWKQTSWLSQETYSGSVKYGSWTYDGFKLDVAFYDDLEEMDLTDNMSEDAFEIIEHSAAKNVKYYPCCSEPYPDLTFKLKFKVM